MPSKRPNVDSRAARPGVDGGMLPVPTLREAVREAVTRTSLRAVADDVPMSSSGLHSFLNGGRPYARTIRLLTAWFVRHHGASGAAAALGGEKLSAAVDAAVGLLVAHLPPAARVGAARRLVATIRTLTDETRAPRPAWLGDDDRSE